MVRRCLLAGALALLFVPPASAGAAVTVRVEGDAGTLVPPTAVPASGPDVVRPPHRCPGTNAIGAFDRATGGDWTGPWFDGLGWALETIKGETYAFPVDRYWVFYVNEVPASFGVCDQVVQDGDRLLFAPSGPGYAAGRAIVLAGVPPRAGPGAPFTVAATVDGGTPLEGVRVELVGGPALATTGADGRATVTLGARGPAALRASRPGEVRSAPAGTCVTDGADGFCATAPPSPALPASSAAPAAAAGVPDRAPPLARIAGIGERRRFARGRGPRELRGTVEAAGSPLRDVRLRLTRRVPATAGGRRTCQTYDAVRERLVTASRCGVEGGRWFSVGDRAAWSYLLPFPLPAGRWVLDVRTVDAAGNVTRGATRGADPSRPRSRVAFFVR